MTTRLSSIIVGFGVLALIGAGCSSGSSNTNANTNMNANAVKSAIPLEPNTVNIQNLAFNPSSSTIKKGTTLTWTNNDNMTHTVTGTNGGPSSGDLAPGKSYSYTFDTVGSFPYHCTIHTTMTGLVTVTN